MKKIQPTIITPANAALAKPQQFGRRKQIGILGGNFNPVHQAHLMIAEQVGHKLGLEKVYFMPEFLPPHVDEKPTIPASQRLRMLELAIADNPFFDIEPIELERGGKSYTYDTMKALTEKNPDTDYYFIIGGDMVEYLPKWYRIADLLQLVNFVGVSRPHYEKRSDYPIIWVDAPHFDLSSSDIRKQVQSGCSIRYLLPDQVLDYIMKEGLYRE